MQITLATTDEDLAAVAGVLRQLPPQYDLASILAQIKKLQDGAGFQVATVIKDGEVICVAGFVITEKLAWGKEFASEQGCQQLHLDSGVQRLDAHRFYDREGFDRSSLHFSIIDL